MLKSKFSKLAMLLGASLMLTSFIACSSDDDDDDDKDTTKTEKTDGTDKTTTSTSVNAVWDFKEGTVTSVELTNILGTNTNVKPGEDFEISADSGSGATLVLVQQNGCSIKSNGGLQLGAGSKETDVIRITCDKACSLEITGNWASGSDWTSAKVNSFSVNGESIANRTAADETAASPWTVSLNKGDNIIAGSGMKFYKFTCK